MKDCHPPSPDVRLPAGRRMPAASLAILAILATANLARSAAANAAPNIVVIVADDLGFGDVGFHGCTDIPTPHLDALAASGVRCTDGYSTHPYCSPMRAALLTGRYQQRFGYETNVPYDPQNPRLGLPPSEKTVADRLRSAGYRTAAVGKWHLGASHAHHPNRRGFDFFFGFTGGGHQYFEVDLAKPMHEGYFQPLDRNGRPEALDGYLTRALTREAVGFIERSREQPFFLYLAYNAPHTPLQAPDDTLARFASIGDQKRRRYAAMVHEMDAGIGEVVAALERHQLRDRTLVFFLSDNGGPEAVNGSDNGPLRGSKGDVFEGGIRVPFVASWPGTLPPGTVFREPVVSIDITRTALAAAGADPGADSRLEGVDLVPFFTGHRDAPPHEALFWRKDGGTAWAVRAGHHKLLVTANRAQPALYDLDADLEESLDLAQSEPALVDRLRSRFDAWNTGNQPPAFPGFREYHQAKGRFYEELDPRD